LNAIESGIDALAKSSCAVFI